MHQHLIAFLDTCPDDELAKLFKWAQLVGESLDENCSPFDQRTFQTVQTALTLLEKH